MKLYFSPGACSLAPHIVLREAGADFTLEKVDTAKHVTSQGDDYYTVNAKGSVPLLETTDGMRLSEGAIIAQYIADSAGNTDLMPKAGTVERYRVMEWQNYVATELHKSFAPLFNNPGVDDAAKGHFAASLQKKFKWVSSQLENKHYLTGDQFTAADAYLFVVAGWSKYVNLDLSEHKNLQAFMARVAERPAVKAALKAEGLTD
jgi:glutathione S-transferase